MDLLGKMHAFALIVFLLVFHVAKSNKDVCQKSPAGYSNCNEVGSLQGMLIFIQSVTHSLSDLVQSARYKANIVEGSFCSNHSQNVTGIQNELCLKAEPDCQALYSIGLKKSGVYRIWPKFLNHSINVFCDMETDNGGWTLIQKRGDYGDPPRNFFETWENYKKGFGNIEQDFWLGNDYIFALTNQGHMTLRIDLEDFDGQKRFAKYNNFLVRSELEKYKLTFEGYEGNAGDSLAPHNGKIFMTKDNGGGCATEFKGGWWYASCHEANLNGLYHRGNHESYADGVNWYQFRGYNHSMKVSEMKIRPCNC